MVRDYRNVRVEGRSNEGMCVMREWGNVNKHMFDTKKVMFSNRGGGGSVIV